MLYSALCYTSVNTYEAHRTGTCYISFAVLFGCACVHMRMHHMCTCAPSLSTAAKIQFAVFSRVYMYGCVPVVHWGMIVHMKYIKKKVDQGK